MDDIPKVILRLCRVIFQLYLSYKALTRAIPSVITRLYARLILGLWRLWRIYLGLYMAYVSYI
jgi:hypothetical protein